MSSAASPLATALDSARVGSRGWVLGLLALVVVAYPSLERSLERQLSHLGRIVTLEQRAASAQREAIGLDARIRAAEDAIARSERLAAEAAGEGARRSAATAAAAQRLGLVPLTLKRQDAANLSAERDREAREQVAGLAEQQRFDILGLSLPVPVYLAAPTWMLALVLLLGTMLAARHRVLRDLAAPGTAGGSGSPAPIWIAPVPAALGTGAGAAAVRAALGWSWSGTLLRTLLALLTMALLGWFALRAAWIGVQLAWITESGFTLIIPGLFRLAVGPTLVVLAVMVPLVAVAALLLVWLLPALMLRLAAAHAALPDPQRRAVLAGGAAGLAWLCTMAYARATETRAVYQARRNVVVAERRSLACRYRRRTLPATAMDVQPGLYLSPLRTPMPVGDSSGGTTRSSRRRRRRMPRVVLPVLRMADAEGRVIGVAPVTLRAGSMSRILPGLERERLFPLTDGSDLPCRRDRRAAEALEAVAIRRAMGGDPEGAIALLLDAAVGATTRRRATEPEQLLQVRREVALIPPDLLRGNVRLLDLAARLARQFRLSVPLAVTAYFAHLHADIFERIAVLRGQAMRRERRVTADAARLAEAMALLGFDRATGHSLRLAPVRRPRVADGLALKDAALARDLKARAERWLDLSRKPGAVPPQARPKLAWHGRHWTVAGDEPAGREQRPDRRATAGPRCTPRSRLTAG